MATGWRLCTHRCRGVPIRGHLLERPVRLKLLRLAAPTLLLATAATASVRRCGWGVLPARAQALAAARELGRLRLRSALALALLVAAVGAVLQEHAARRAVVRRIRAVIHIVRFLPVVAVDR